MINPQQFVVNQLYQNALNNLQQNPKIAETPMGQEFTSILQRGDEAAGIEMANNILNSMGITREQGMYMAHQMGII